MTMKGPGSFLMLVLPVVISAFFGTTSFTRRHLRCQLSASSLASDASLQPSDVLAGRNYFSKKKKVAIVGGGPAGLASAIMLARRGYKDVQVFERLSMPAVPDDEGTWSDFENERSYNIGVNGRGQRALEQLGALEKVNQFSVDCVGRMDWSPEDPIDKPKETINKRAYNPKIIQRERLTSCLVDEIRTKYSDAITLHFDCECQEMIWRKLGRDDEMCVLTMLDKSGKQQTVEASLVIGAEGGGRGRTQTTVRDAMERDRAIQVTRFEDKNVRVYRTIPLYLADAPAATTSGTSVTSSKTNSISTGTSNNKKSWRGDVNYSARTKSDINIDALPTKSGVYLGVVLYRPWDERIKMCKDGQDTRMFFNSVFPQFSPYIKDADLDRFAKQKDLKLPIFSYTGPVLHRGRTACLVGDSIHTVKPYFGVGLNSAFEDVVTLNTALDLCDDNIPSALAKYSALRARDAKAIVQMSKGLDGGFFTFVLPLIIDTILNRIAPLFFSPNTIASMQNPDSKFRHIQRRKRIDRFFQTVLFTGTMATCIKIILTLFAWINIGVMKMGFKRLF